MSKTVFSKIIDRDVPAFIVWEDEAHCAFLDRNPITPGHTLLVPKEPIEYIFDMDAPAYNAIWRRAHELAQSIQTAMQCKRVGIMVEGFRVPHVHIHLVPISDGDDLDPANAQRMENDELKSYQKRVLKHIGLENNMP